MTSESALNLAVVNDTPVVLSSQVADHFDKPHSRVLGAIRRILKELPEEIRESYFRRSSYSGPVPNGGTRKYPAYQMTRDGFSLLAMGFTGKKALAWKIAYIQAFNSMEEELSQQPPPAIHESHDVVSLLRNCADQVYAAKLSTLYTARFRLPRPEGLAEIDAVENVFSSAEKAINSCAVVARRINDQCPSLSPKTAI